MDELMKSSTDLSRLLQILEGIYQNSMPFNRHLGITITCLSVAEVVVRVDMREELIGNFIRKILHGGVIASVLDLTGGLLASVEILKTYQNETPDTIVKKMSHLNTVDLRIDYLRAGQGSFFTATGSVLRSGNRVTVTRTELHNDSLQLIAAGTGTYMIG